MRKRREERKLYVYGINDCVAPRGYVSLESGLELHVVHPLWRLFCGRGTPPYGGAITLYGPFTVTSISFPKIATTGEEGGEGVKRGERQEREQSAIRGWAPVNALQMTSSSHTRRLFLLIVRRLFVSRDNGSFSASRVWSSRPTVFLC